MSAELPAGDDAVQGVVSSLEARAHELPANEAAVVRRQLQLLKRQANFLACASKQQNRLANESGLADAACVKLEAVQGAQTGALMPAAGDAGLRHAPGAPPAADAAVPAGAKAGNKGGATSRPMTRAPPLAGEALERLRRDVEALFGVADSLGAEDVRVVAHKHGCSMEAVRRECRALSRAVAAAAPQASKQAAPAASAGGPAHAGNAQGIEPPAAAAAPAVASAAAAAAGAAAAKLRALLDGPTGGISPTPTSQVRVRGCAYLCTACDVQCSPGLPIHALVREGRHASSLRISQLTVSDSWVVLT